MFVPFSRKPFSVVSGCRQAGIVKNKISKRSEHNSESLFSGLPAADP